MLNTYCLETSGSVGSCDITTCTHTLLAWRRASSCYHTSGLIAFARLRSYRVHIGAVQIAATGVKRSSNIEGCGQMVKRPFSPSFLYVLYITVNGQDSINELLAHAFSLGLGQRVKGTNLV